MKTDGPSRFRFFDLTPSSSKKGSTRGTAVPGAQAVLDAIEIDFSFTETINRWVQIIDVTAGNRVVTAIEILSPANCDAGKANERYRRKLDDFMNAGVNVVKIDLLRSSRSRLILKADSFPPGRLTPYAACIWRAARRSKITLIPILLRLPLPTIPIPCRENDPEVPLSLQPLIDQIYIDGGNDDIDYKKPLREPLAAEDAAWAAGLVAATR